MALRGLPAGVGLKSPSAALVKSSCREREGKGVVNTSDVNREDEHQLTIIQVSKLNRRHQNRGGYVAPGQVHRKPVYWVDGVRHRDGVSPILAFMRNCRNLLL